MPSHLWSRLGRGELFRDLAARRRPEFDVEAGVRAIVFGRVVDPCSERATIRWLDRVYAAGHLERAGGTDTQAPQSVRIHSGKMKNQYAV